MCGSPMDVLELKNGSAEADSSDILFVLIDLYKSVNVIALYISVFLYSTCDKLRPAGQTSLDNIAALI